MKFKLFFYYWLPIIVYMLIIFYFPSRSIVGIEVVLEERGLEIKRGIIHIIEYAVLSFLLYRALIKSRFGKYSWVLAIIISIFYGLIDEVHQIFVVGRYFDFLDLFFDSIGAFLMQILIKIKKLYRKS